MSIAEVALTAPEVAPLEIPGWACDPYEIQTRGIAWLYGTPRGFLADVTGTGKTIHGIGLTALLRARGELNRAVFVVLAGTVGQWREEFERFLPECNVVTVQGMSKGDRTALYRYDGWEVLIVGYEVMRRDADHIAALQPGLVWFDESTAFKNRETATAEGARKLSTVASRVVCASATPLQNNLLDLFSQLEVLGFGGPPNSVFGTLEQFSARYVIFQTEQIRAKGGRLLNQKRIVGYQNLDELRTKLTPLWLRRTEGSGDMPDVVPEDVWLEMGKAQAAVYKDLQESDLEPGAKLTYLLQATSTPAGLGHDDDSAKLDWVETFLTERTTPDEKVVIFARWLGTVSALSRRLSLRGVGYRVISGSHTGIERDQARRDFWEDPEVRVMIITTAGEAGLNLQIARYCICVDLMWNPARLEQVIGRIKRSGSPHDHVYMLRLVTPASVEHGILKLLRSKQALADYLNGDESQLFRELTPAQLEDIVNA